MRTFRNTDKTALRRRVAQGLRGFHRDDGGAIILLALAAVMILMMLAWVLWDAGKMGRHKLTVQAAADTAAYSQAAIKARAMNNLAYANIAKRSTVGIHSQYKALWESYKRWFALQVALCAAGDDSACQRVSDNQPILEAERENDFATFRDELGEQYYLQDLIAIDNYQRYTHALTPWWGWSEAVLRAARNGAGMAASFPAPQGTPKNAPILDSVTDQVMTQVGSTPLVKYTGHRDLLPVKISDYNYMLGTGMSQGLSFMGAEYEANNQLHKQNSEAGAASQAVIQGARNHFSSAVTGYSQSVFGEYGKPWKLFRTTNPAHWTSWTSNLVVTYRRKEELFDEMRQKYGPVPKDYELDNEEMFRLSGYWGMARAEISFQDSSREPTLWHPRWTARMRPVALPGEFQQAGLQMSSIYHDMIPYLALSGIITTGDSGIVNDSIDDLVFMERANRALGQSTVEGIAK
jgi:hypothetical protein